MLFVPLADFAAAQEQGASLTGLTPDGRTMEMPNESLCCLHTEEWQGAKPRIEALLTEKNSRLPLDKGSSCPIISTFINMEPEIRCKAADFCIYLAFFQNKKLSERTAFALLAECADDDIDDQTDRGCDRVDRALLTARLCLGSSCLSSCSLRPQIMP